MILSKSRIKPTSRPHQRDCTAARNGGAYSTLSFDARIHRLWPQSGLLRSGDLPTHRPATAAPPLKKGAVKCRCTDSVEGHRAWPAFLRAWRGYLGKDLLAKAECRGPRSEIRFIRGRDV